MVALSNCKIRKSADSVNHGNHLLCSLALDRLTACRWQMISTVVWREISEKVLIPFPLTMLVSKGRQKCFETNSKVRDLSTYQLWIALTAGAIKIIFQCLHFYHSARRQHKKLKFEPAKYLPKLNTATLVLWIENNICGTSGSIYVLPMYIGCTYLCI